MIRAFNYLTFGAILLAGIAVDTPDSLAQTEPRNPGYETPANFSQLPTLRFRPSAGRGSDTLRLIEMIEEAAGTRTRVPGPDIFGARIMFTNGTYRIRGIALESNVHLRFGRDVTLLLDESSVPGISGSTMFRLGGDIENVSIVGNANTRRVRLVAPATPSDPLDPAERFRAVSVGDATNFLIRNLEIESRFSRFSSIFLAAEGANPDESVDGPVPTQGEFSNVDSIGNNGGFGAIQMHAGRQIECNNIEAIGGVTLRLESGIANVTGIQDLSARNIRNVNGRCAVLFQPHSVRAHNRIRIRDVESTGSAFAIEFLNGFVSSRDRSLNRPEFTRPGRFRNLSVARVTANFGVAGNAQIRPAHFRLVPGNTLPFLPDLGDFIDGLRSNGDTIAGPPLAAIVDNAIDYTPSIVRSTVRSRGFPAGSRATILTRSTRDRNSEESSLRSGYRELNTMADALR